MINSETLTLLDNLAHHFKEACEGIRFAAAASPEEIEAIYRLRYRTVIENGWAKPEDYPDGMEQDEYDDHAIHIGGWQEEQLAATMRLVLPSQDRLLPTEAAFGLRIEPTGQVADCSRGIVAPEFRNRGRLLFFGTLAQVWLEMRSHGYYELCGTLTGWMIRYYQRSGFSLVQLGPPQMYWGELRFPAKFDLIKTACQFLQQGRTD